MAASESTLNKIHEFFAQYLLDLMSPQEDEDGNLVPARLTAAEMGVITKFLKDNNISFAGGGEDDDEIEQMRQRAREAALASGFSRQDLEESIEGLDFRKH